jgi:hypothetical protein
MEAKRAANYSGPAEADVADEEEPEDE